MHKLSAELRKVGSQLFFFGHFLVIDRNVFEMTEKNCRFGQNVRKYRLVNTVTASFYTTVRQITEMFQ